MHSVPAWPTVRHGMRDENKSNGNLRAIDQNKEAEPVGPPREAVLDDENRNSLSEST
jgi:hypothetical protein